MPEVTESQWFSPRRNADAAAERDRLFEAWQRLSDAGRDFDADVLIEIDSNLFGVNDEGVWWRVCTFGRT